jgi:myo-inositol-1(or 4)-monophosphatase
MKDFLSKLTKEAGDRLLEAYNEQNPGLVRMRTSSKGAAIAQDKISDEFIVGEIKKAYPDYSILSEEGGLKEGKPDYKLIVDSLDGTSNFANHNPLWSVCIALMKGDAVVMGAVYAPVLGEFYFAEKGKGVFLNGNPIRVSEIAELDKSYLVHCEGGEKDRQRQLRIIDALYPRVTDERKIGSAGIETAWVAAGRADAYFTTRIEPWDVAPGVLLVQEAGGQVSDFKGNTWQAKTNDLVFSNGKVHEAVLERIRNL